MRVPCISLLVLVLSDLVISLIVVILVVSLLLIVTTLPVIVIIVLPPIIPGFVVLTTVTAVMRVMMLLSWVKVRALIAVKMLIELSLTSGAVLAFVAVLFALVGSG